MTLTRGKWFQKRKIKWTQYIENSFKKEQRHGGVCGVRKGGVLLRWGILHYAD